VSNPIDDFLATAKPAECEVALCLDRDIRDRHQAADLTLRRLLAREAVGLTDDAKKAAADTLAAEQHEAAEAVQAIETEMVEHETIFLLRDIDWTTRAVLLAIHPPRDDVITDRRAGYNQSTLYPALVGKCIATITLPGEEPTEVTPEQWERFAAVLEPDQMEQLAAAAIRLVWRPADPKSVTASQILSNHSGPKSRQRGRSGSRTSGS
jgi:hypothetical protein